MRKFIIITSVILGILAVLAGVYFAWLQTRTILTPPDTGQQSAGDGQQPTTDEQSLTTQKLKIISDQSVFSYWIFQGVTAQTVSTSTAMNSDRVFYISQEGKIFELNGESEAEVVVPEPIDNLQAVKSSADGKNIIIKFGDLNSPKFVIFNSEAKVFETLPDDISAAAFSPDSKKVVYLERTNGDLMVKDLANAKNKTAKITSFTQKDFDLDWISAQKIILVPKPSAFYSASAWMVDVQKKTINPLMNAVNGLMIGWSSDGEIGLEFSVQSAGQKGNLNLIDNQGLPEGNLNFVTFPDKCFISEPLMYCAVPEDMPSGAVLPDDYLKRAIYFKDSFYQIDTEQNSITEILAATDPFFDAVNLALTDGKLFFINRYDNNLYSLEL